MKFGVWVPLALTAVLGCSGGTSDGDDTGSGGTPAGDGSSEDGQCEIQVSGELEFTAACYAFLTVHDGAETRSIHLQSDETEDGTFQMGITPVTEPFTGQYTPEIVIERELSVSGQATPYRDIQQYWKLAVNQGSGTPDSGDFELSFDTVGGIGPANWGLDARWIKDGHLDATLVDPKTGGVVTVRAEF